METGLNTRCREHFEVRLQQRIAHAEHYVANFLDAYLSGHHDFLAIASLASLVDEMAKRIEFLESQQKAG